MKAAAIAAVLLSLGLATSTPQPQFRASASLVRFEVSVTNDRGAVPGLRDGDFVVLDRGVRQTIRIEESADAPLDLVLVAQPMGSVAYLAGDQVSRVAAGLSAFLGQVQERDRLGALVAGAPPARLRSLEFGRPSFNMDVFDGGLHAAPFDAIAAALREFVDTDRRRALVAFTNAADFRSIVSFERLAEMAQRLGPAFVLVGTPVRVASEFTTQALRAGGGTIGDPVSGVVGGHVFPVTLSLLARRTGGITVNLGSGDPTTLIEEMFAWLRTQYVISYEPPAGKGWHPVSVKVSRRGAKVTVREGYFVD